MRRRSKTAVLPAPSTWSNVLSAPEAVSAGVLEAAKVASHRR